MKRRIIKTGSSWGFTLAPSTWQLLGIKLGDEVEVTIKKKVVTLTIKKGEVKNVRGSKRGRNRRA